MNQKQAEQFLKALGVKHVQYKPGWVTSPCPFAPFRHKGGKDTSPSFGLSWAPGKHSHFNCFACGSGPAEELLQALDMYTVQRPDLRERLDFHTARALLDAEAEEMVPLPGYSEFGQEQIKEFEEWPWHFINSFLPVNDEARAYLHHRQVTDDQIHQHQMRWDYLKRMIVMPYLNVWGKLAGARGRAIDMDLKGWHKHYDYRWNDVNNAALVWYNEPCLQQDGPVVVVEGQFDVLRVEPVYPKVVANMTALPTAYKLKRLLHSPLVVLIPDNDGPGGAGEKSVLRYRQFFAEHQETKLVVLSLPTPEDGTKLDPGDCHPDFLRELLSPYVNLV